MDTFFKDLFVTYPVSDKRWSVYSQHSFKVAIKYTNTTGTVREMTEIRSGRDGTVELKDGRPHLLQPNETRWICIEPSNKAFKYDDSGTYGAAAYPKRNEDVRHDFKALSGSDMITVYHSLKKAKMVIPFYQIAATVLTLYPSITTDAYTLAKTMKMQLLQGDPMLGLHGIVRVFQSKARCLGRLVQDKKFSSMHPTFPMGYRAVPIEKGCLIIIDLEPTLKLKYGTVKYNVNGSEIKALVIARIIDAPAVKGAQWKKLDVNISNKRIANRLTEAAAVLCDPKSYFV